MTVSGADPNKPCIFPFTTNTGQTWNTCTIVDDPSAPAWCSTKVDDQGNHIGGQGNWGNCDVSKCPMPGACMEKAWQPINEVYLWKIDKWKGWKDGKQKTSTYKCISFPDSALLKKLLDR